MLLPVRFLYVNKCLVQDSRLCLHRPIAAVFVCGVCVGDTWNFTGNYLEFLRGILFFIVLPIHKLDPRDKIILYHYTEKKCKKASSTLRTSRAVTHPSTIRAFRRLTSEFGWDPVFSTQYGR